MFLLTSRTVIEKKALYTSNYNNLFFEEGTFSFEYAEVVEPEIIEEPEPEPESEPEETEDDDGWFDDWDSSEEDFSSDWDSPAEEVAEPQTVEEILSEEPLPIVQGPIIKFSNTNLKFETPDETSTLFGTSGSVLLLTNEFVGEGGKFDWSSAGLDSEQVYCELKEYSFDITMPRLAASGVQLTYANKVPGKVEGVFEYKSTKAKTESKTVYPRFKSYKNNVNVNVSDGGSLSYFGGFALEGAKISSSSVLSESATISVADASGKRFKAISRRFILGDSAINSKQASVVIYQGKDSIYHPGVSLDYVIQDEYLTLLTGQGGFKKTPFFASYFNIDFSAEMVKWNLNVDSLDISNLNARSQIPAVFQSLEYFDKTKFNRLSGLYDFHPLLMAVGYARSINSGTFYSADMATKRKKNPKLVKSAMIDLMQRGFIHYNTATDLVKIQRKGYHYVVSNRKKKDYDNMLLESISAGAPNGTLYFQENKLKVRGIEKFYLNEVLEVYIEPVGGEIVLNDNRNFEFDGNLNAGNFSFVGGEFRFDYDNFSVAMPKIDSIKISVGTGKKRPKKQKTEAGN